MGVPCTFDSINVGITRHAVARFRERIDPTATVEQIRGYLRQAQPSERIRGEMREYGYSLFDVFVMYRKLTLRHLHISFVVAVCKGKGRAVELVTCY